MTYSSLPRSGLVREYLLDGSAADTNDGTKSDGTRTNITDAVTGVGYHKQCASFNGSSSKITITNPLGASQTAFSISLRIKLGSTSGFQYIIGPGSNGIYFIYNNTNSKIEAKVYYSGGYHLICQADQDVGKWHDYRYEWSTSQGNAKLYVDDVLVSTSSDSVGSALDVSQALTLGTYNGGAVSWYNGLMQDVRFYNRVLTETERLSLWHEFNRKLGGGSDFGAVIPAPTAHLEAVGEDTFYDVALATKATRTAGTVANDDFGISRAIAGPNQSWTSVTGDSFVYWNNSGWKLEKNQAAVTATGINTANTVRAVIYYPAGTVTAAQQTYLENCFKSGRYPYAFRRSLPNGIRSKASLWIPGIVSGTTAYDLSGNGNNGTTSGSPISLRAQQNNALSFNGSSQSVTVPNLSGIFGVSMWVYATAVSKTLFTYTAGKTISLDGSYGVTSAGLTSPVYYVNRGVGQGGSGSKWMLVTVAHASDSISSGSWATSSLTGKASDLFLWNETPTQEAIQQLYSATYRN